MTSMGSADLERLRGREPHAYEIEPPSHVPGKPQIEGGPACSESGWLSETPQPQCHLPRQKPVEVLLQHEEGQQPHAKGEAQQEAPGVVTPHCQTTAAVQHAETRAPDDPADAPRGTTTPEPRTSVKSEQHGDTNVTRTDSNQCDNLPPQAATILRGHTHYEEMTEEMTAHHQTRRNRGNQDCQQRPLPLTQVPHGVEQSGEHSQKAHLSQPDEAGHGWYPLNPPRTSRGQSERHPDPTREERTHVGLKKYSGEDEPVASRPRPAHHSAHDWPGRSQPEPDPGFPQEEDQRDHPWELGSSRPCRVPPGSKRCEYVGKGYPGEEREP
ncbi:hypothetical protein EV361DRAFT_872104 [Lentinula raphanica]|nr:hypothetical protein EV361DRAFT_872104 [Lentinula raphanica]